MVKVVVFMLLGVTIGTLGDIFLAQGMKALGEISVKKPADAWRLAVRAFHTRIPLAILFMIACFVVWLTVLSWADLTLVLPIAALSYVLNAVLAKPLLGETVSLRRWVGTVIIVIGVVTVIMTGKA